MPVQRGYEQQVSPSQGPGFAQAGPDAFGAGIGDAVDQAAHAYRQALADQDLSGFNARFAKIRADNDKAFTDLQTQPGSTDGYHAGVTAVLDQQQDQLLSGIRDPQVRRQAQAQYQNYVAEQSGRAYAWQAGQQAIRTAKDGEFTMNTLADTVGSSADPNAVGDATRMWGEYSHSLQGVTDVQRDAIARQGYQAISRSDLFRKINGNAAAGIAPDPNSAIASIDAGHYNDLGFPPEELQQIRRSAEVAATSIARQNKAQADQARAAAIKSLDLTAAGYKDGRPSYQQAVQLAAQYEALGEPQKALEWRGQAADVGAAEQYRDATPVERQAAIDALAAKSTLTPEQGHQLEGLRGQQKLLSGYTTLQRLGYARGTGIAPIDPTDPNAIRSRIVDVQAAYARYGGTKDFYTPQEAQQVQALVKGSVDDRIEAARSIALAGPLAGVALNQVGGDETFRAAATLAPLTNGAELMNDVLRGPDISKALPNLMVPAKDPDSNQPVSAKPDEIFQAMTAYSHADLPGDYIRSLKVNADNLYASLAHKLGRTSFDATLYQGAVQAVSGAQRTSRGWTGGFGRINGQYVKLPADFTQGDMETRIARATGPEWLAASINGPAVTNHGPMTSGEARSYIPVAVGGGLYALKSGGSYAMTKDGSHFLFDPKKLPGVVHPAPAPKAVRPITVLPGIGEVR